MRLRDNGEIRSRVKKKSSNTKKHKVEMQVHTSKEAKPSRKGKRKAGENYEKRKKELHLREGSQLFQRGVL